MGGVESDVEEFEWESEESCDDVCEMETETETSDTETDEDTNVHPQRQGKKSFLVIFYTD